eukprot:COSAG02_NODE_20_length_53673_cov_86.864841_11_plen_1053_part_00
MDEGVVVAALLRGSPEVARSLTQLRCWPSSSFAAVYDELARARHLHRLLLRVQQPVLLLEDVLSCGGGDAGRTRLVALVDAVAGRPAEKNILTLMVEVNRRVHDGRSPQRLCLVEALCEAGATDFARKLDASIARDMCYPELSVAELVEHLERDHSSASSDSTSVQLSASKTNHVRRAVLRELCRRCCGPNRAQLDGLSHAIIVEMLRYGCPDVLTEPIASGGCTDVLLPTAVAILHAFLCGTPTENWVDTPPVLRDHAGGRLLQRFVRGVAACVYGSWQHACLHKDPSAATSHISSALSSVFQYATSVQMLLVTTAGRRVLQHVGQEPHQGAVWRGEAVATHDSDNHQLELSFSWVEVHKLQVQTAASTSGGLRDNEAIGRLAHFWLFLASRADRASDVWAQWHAAIGNFGVASQPAASRLRSTLTDILDLILWPTGRRPDPARGIKRNRDCAEPNVDNVSIKQRIKHNLPLLGCLHSLMDVMIGSVHNLPDLHHDAMHLCAVLLDAFDGIVTDVLHIKRLRQPEHACGSAATGGTKSLDNSLMYVSCSGAILQLVHSICTFVNGLDEECCALVSHHHAELIRSRFGRLGGVPPMPIFAVVAVHVTRSMFRVDGDYGPAVLAAGTRRTDLRDPDGQKQSHRGQLWRLFGEIVLQLRRWHTFHDKEEANVLSSEILTALLTAPAQKLVLLQRDYHSGPSYEVEQQAWCKGVVRELLLCLHERHRTDDTQDCDEVIIAVLDAMGHLVSQPCQQELAVLWELDAAATPSHEQDTCDICNSTATEVMATCANLARIKCRDMSRIQGEHAGLDRCCAGAVKVMLGLLRATAKVSSNQMQKMSIGVMLTETRQPTANVTDVISSLIECGFGNVCVSFSTCAACARCLQYVAGLHDALAVAVLASSALFSDNLLAQGVARMEQADQIHDSIFEFVASVAGLLAICVERATSAFWRQFGDDERFFTLLRCMLDAVLHQTSLSDRGNSAEAPMSFAATRAAATHAIRLVGNVADAVTFASKLNKAGLPQRLQHVADKGAEIGLSSEGCARVAQMVRAISS